MALCGNQFVIHLQTQISIRSIKQPNNEITIKNSSSCGQQKRNNFEDTPFYILKPTPLPP